MTSAFTLGAKSGVNLRGETNFYNETLFENLPFDEEPDQEMDSAVEELAVPGDAQEETAAAAKVEEGANATVEEEDEEGAVKDDVEDGETKDESVSKVVPSDRPRGPASRTSSSSARLLPLEADASSTETSREPFYSSFWALQRVFANPSLLSTSLPESTTPATSPPASLPFPFADFKAKADRVLVVLSEQTTQEQVLRGSGSTNGKRKGTVEKLDEVFMPKFLTSPGLLDFEVRLSCPPFACSVSICSR